MRTHAAHNEIVVLADEIEVPGIGHLPVNAFVLRAEQPVLVDTGAPRSRADFLAAVDGEVALEDLRWIWLTHPDRDHTGALVQLLEAAPRARLVTTFLGMGILSIEHDISPERVHLLNPGQALDVGDRTLTAFRPPLFDSPATTGFVDSRTGACFSSDCFGAPVASAELALADDAAAVAPDELTAGQQLWATVDSPWVHDVEPTAYAAAVRRSPVAGAPLVLSTHLPPARGRTDELLELVAGAPALPPYVGPDQAALEAVLAGFAPEQRGAEQRHSSQV